MCVDCIIVVLTIIGLRKFDPTSDLAAALKYQGLAFFFLVLLFQTVVTVSRIRRVQISIVDKFACCLGGGVR